jgi:hypothetical protein
MYVALSNKDANRTCGSALLHEFGHCMLMDMGTSGDCDHSDTDFWQVIENARVEACNRGW